MDDLLDRLPPDAQDSGVRWCTIHHQRKQTCIKEGFRKKDCNIVPLFYLAN